MFNRVTVPAMADIHFHLREKVEGLMRFLMLASQAGGADLLGLMPNLAKALLKAEQMIDYVQFAERVSGDMDRPMSFMPIAMVNEQTTLQDIDDMLAAGIRHVKIYPRDRTTKSHAGVRDYHNLLAVIEYGGQRGMIFHFHPEHPNLGFYSRDAEFVFLAIFDMFIRATEATLVWEHGTDARCIRFWEEWAETGRFYVTLTAHHLATNEDKVFGDVRAVCKPPIKTSDDQRGLCNLVYQGHPWVLAGSDSAYHDKDNKHVPQGSCACGDFTAPYLVPWYAHALPELFRDEIGVRIFSDFISGNARRAFGLPPASREITLVRQSQTIPIYWPDGGEWSDSVQNFGAGQEIDWQLA